MFFYIFIILSFLKILLLLIGEFYFESINSGYCLRYCFINFLIEELNSLIKIFYFYRYIIKNYRMKGFVLGLKIFEFLIFNEIYKYYILKM